MTPSVLAWVSTVLAYAIAWRRGPLELIVRTNVETIRLCARRDDEPSQAVRRALQVLCAHWLDMLSFFSGYSRATRDRVLLSGLEGIAEVRAQGRGAVIVSFHMGRYELSAAVASAAVEGGITSVARTLKSPTLQSFVDAARAAAGNDDVVFFDPKDKVDRARVSSRLLRKLLGGGVVGLMLDRYPVGNTVSVPFLGGRIRLAEGPISLALRSGAAILPSVTWQDGRVTRGHIGEEVVVSAVGSRTDQCRQALELIAQAFEQHVRDHPYDWHLDAPLFD